jgi:hypothetical protein
MAPLGYGVLGVVVGDKKILHKDESILANHSFLSLFTYSGQLTQYKQIHIFGAQTVVYAIMKPCGFYRLFGIGQHHCTNTNSDLLDLLPENHHAIKHQFEDCDNPKRTLAILETLLLQLLSERKEKHHLPKFASIIEHLKQQSHQPLLLKQLIKKYIGAEFYGICRY